MPCKPSCTRFFVAAAVVADNTSEPGQRRGDMACGIAQSKVGQQSHC
jgi:hypothetical protein